MLGGSTGDAGMTTQPRPLMAAVQSLIILAVAWVVSQLISPAQAVTGDLAIKLLFLGRMLLLLALATGFLRMRGLSWADTGLRRPRWGRFALAVPLGLVACALAATASTLIFARAGLPAPGYQVFTPIRGHFDQYLFWLLPVTWGSAALGEELIFRGFVMNALEAVLGASRGVLTLLAILLQAAIFGLLHIYLGPAGAANAAAIGLVLGGVWLASGRNLWACIVIHGLIDSMAMTAIYFGGMSH